MLIVAVFRSKLGVETAKAVRGRAEGESGAKEFRKDEVACSVRAFCEEH